MHPGWSAYFNYAYFRQLLHTARCHFTTHRLSEAPYVLYRGGPPILFLRHDIKVSLSKALPMAEIEHEYGLRTTFMVRADSPLYSLDERNSRVQLLELVQMGHEVGLHFDPVHDERQNLSFLGIIETQMRAACERVEQIICRPIRSISFQRSVPQMFGRQLQVDGRINADARELRNWCISDAGGDWQDGEPLSRITQPAGPVLQLILHPIWWGDKPLPAPQRLQEFFESATCAKPAREAGIFDIELAKTIPTVRRQGIYALMSGGREA